MSKRNNRACVSLVAIGRFYSMLLAYKSALEGTLREVGAREEYLGQIEKDKKALEKAKNECESKINTLVSLRARQTNREKIAEYDQHIARIKGVSGYIDGQLDHIEKKLQSYNLLEKKSRNVINDALSKVTEAEKALKNAIAVINSYITESTGEIRLDSIPSFKTVPFGAERVVPFQLYDMPQIVPPKPILPIDDFGVEYYFGSCDSHFGDEKRLIKRQGKAYENYHGTCGPTTVANMLRLLQGREATEKEVLDLAISINACRRPRDGATGGGTTSLDIIRILECYGLRAACIRDVSLEEIDECLKRNGALMIAIHSSHIKENASINENPGPKIYTNHWVCVLGVRRSKRDERVVGLYLCDTGGHNPKKSVIYVSRTYFEMMKQALVDLYAVTAFK